MWDLKVILLFNYLHIIVIHYLFKLKPVAICKGLYLPVGGAFFTRYPLLS